MEDDENSRVEDDEFFNEQEQEQQMLELNEIFSRFKDDPTSDFINVNRLAEVLQAFGRNPSYQDAAQRISELEAAGKYDLSLDDVLELVDEHWAVINNDRDVLRQAFAKFDTTQEGYIDIDKFRTIMTTLGEPLNDDELDDLLQLGLNDDQTKINIDFLLDQLLGINV